MRFGLYPRLPRSKGGKDEDAGKSDCLANLPKGLAEHLELTADAG